MLGFTKDAIILFPREENYWSKDDLWVKDFNIAAKKMVDFIVKYFGVKPYILTTDALGVFMSLDNVVYLNASASEDLFFARRNCEGLGKMPEGVNVDEDIYKASRDKYPVTRGMSTHERFAVLVDREKMNLKKIVQDCKLVVSFENQNSPQYRVYKDLKKDRAVLIVNSNNFTVKCYFNGEEIGISDFTTLPWTLNPVNKWGV